VKIDKIKMSRLMPTKASLATVNTIVAILIVVAMPAIAEQSVLGCGGFIKASKSIDFSKIDVQLLTKQGSLKYETDCAPNNGYFFIPVYEKGEYVLKVSPPLGWKFTPEEVPVTIDGETDMCSQNKDINFIFAGFGVVGQVVVAGDSGDEKLGPAGVNIELLTKDEKEEVVQRTVTVKDGKYVFTAVAGAAEHRVRAHHPVWQFEKQTGNVVITGDNGRAEDLVVAGFDVSGRVVAGNQPIGGVQILLFGNKDSKDVVCPSVSGAEKSVDDGSPVAKQGQKELCRTVTNAKGEFVFPVVPRGQYSLAPFYRGEHTQFEVAPATSDIEVGLDSYRLTEPFVVQGFSVKGRVLAGGGGDGNNGAMPIANAKVVLSKIQQRGSVTANSEAIEHTAVTDKQGVYFIDRIESGEYRISADVDGISFETVTTAISPSQPLLPPLVAGKFRVSGQLDFSTVSPDSERKVKIVAAAAGDGHKQQSEIIASLQDNGQFELMLSPAAYTVSVVPSTSDRQMGIVFAPLGLDISVRTQPVGGLYFSPVRVTVAGTVQCVGGKCPDQLRVVLRPESNMASMAGGTDESVQLIKAGRFSFQNQLPGRYTIAMEEMGGLCWQQPAIEFRIESESKEDLHFVQTGWVMDVHASHETGAKYKSEDGKLTGSLSIPVGASSHCLSANTQFVIQTTSCHQFQGEHKGFKWMPGERLTLRAEKHIVSGRVSCVETIPDLQLMVRSSTDTKTMALTQPENRDGLQVYRFSYLSNPHEEISMEPLAAKFLFDPTKLHISVEDECQIDSAVFSATKGLFVSGSIRPVLEGANIQLTSSALPSPVTTTTDAKGNYLMGPFPRDLKYEVTASKIGYIISMTDKVGHFHAEKLASIVVNVVDSNGQRLAEAVVSLSGGEQNFRTNQQTGANGTLSFLGLSPGEYFIKPLLKEYEFSPKSKLITVKEGTEEVVSITATRIANSLFGVLTSLKGDPEAGVTVEVVGQGETCQGHQEEGATASDGKFRIRGLTPKCEYRLGLKHSKVNSHVERTIPSMQIVKADVTDITGVEMIAIRPRTSMDVSLLVKAKKDNIKNVKAKLFCYGNMGSPLHTIKLDTVKFVIFPSIPSDGKECWIHVEANSVHLNQRVKPQKVEFTADKPFQHFTVDLEIESSLMRGEMGQSSWMTLPLILLLVTIVLHWNKVSPYMSNLADQIERTLMKRRNTSRGPRGGSPTAQAGEDEMSSADIDKAVKFVEASTRKKTKLRKI